MIEMLQNALQFIISVVVIMALGVVLLKIAKHGLIAIVLTLVALVIAGTLL